MELLVFYPTALLCVVLALCVILNKNPVGSAVCLIGMMLGLAAVFAVLHAHFLAILQVLVYAGAIMVLFMFVIMLLNLKGDDVLEWKTRQKNTLLTSMTVALVLMILYKFTDIGSQANFNHLEVASIPSLTTSDTFGTTEMVGKILFTDYVLPFEVASILLLVAMIGAVVLAKTPLD